jgi:hypothetical protein
VKRLQEAQKAAEELWQTQLKDIREKQHPKTEEIEVTEI